MFARILFAVAFASFGQFAGPTYDDTYSSLIDTSKRESWGPYNVHDPSLVKAGDWYYMYSTDAMVAYDPPAIIGIQVRKSRDLIDWKFTGFAFKSIPPEAAGHLSSSGKAATSFWAPGIVKHGNEFRLYYCVSSFGTNVSYLGLAVSASPEGPWTQRGCVVKTDNNVAMNAIDPAVAQGTDGRQWLFYGSYFDGIYRIALDTATGLAEKANDKGVCIARRQANGNSVEGAEILYNDKEKKYYLFYSYDNLLDKYNIRVGRSDKPEGPYYDVNNVDLSSPIENYPMILHPYKFNGHAGWQGTGHCGVIRDDAGQWYLVHQGRPAVDKFMMVAHVRKIEWVKGWPVVSPERYGGTPKTGYPAASDIPGKWEHIVLAYQVTGFNFANPMFTMELKNNGAIDANAANTWTYKDGLLCLRWNSGQYHDTAKVWYEWDWENRRVCMVYSGFGHENVCVWGKSLHNGGITASKTAPGKASMSLVLIRWAADGRWKITINGTGETDIRAEIVSLSGKILLSKRFAFSRDITVSTGPASQTRLMRIGYNGKWVIRKLPARSGL